MLLDYLKKNLLQRKIKYSPYAAHTTCNFISMCNFIKDACLGVQLGRDKTGWMKGSPRDTETAATSICSSTCRPSHDDYFCHFVEK